MFHTRADAVSGSKVFANGKWLSCIGNKSVKAGEYIWTDGRCVYANHQVPQQPLFIRYPKIVTGIPIIIYNESNSWQLYTYKKNKLKSISSIAAGTKDGMMITSFTGDIFVSTGKCIKTDGNNRYQLLAVSIDSQGNYFEIIFNSNSDQIGSVEIFKNGVVTKTIALEPDGSNPAFHVYQAFIENETRWQLLVHFESTETDHSKIILPDGTQLDQDDTPYSFTTTNRYVLYQPDGETLLCKHTFVSYPWASDVDIQKTYGVVPFKNTSEYYTENIKIFLHDNYYYMLRPCIESDVAAAALFYRDYFSPNDEKIFELISTLVTKTVIAKAGNCFLLGVRAVGINNVQMLPTVFFNESEINSNEPKRGLFLFRNGEWEELLTGYCINLRLLPIKKCNDWVNNIKTINFLS